MSKLENYIVLKNYIFDFKFRFQNLKFGWLILSLDFKNLKIESLILSLDF